MGCECFKPRGEELPPRLPSKAGKVTKVESEGEQLLKDMQELSNSIRAPKNASATLQAFWTPADFKAYGEFLTALAQQTEALEQSAAISLLGLPTEGVPPEEVIARCQAMAAFVAELRGLHEPGALPDSDWLEVVKQLVSKKHTLLACKHRYEQLLQLCLDYQDAAATLPDEAQAQTLKAQVQTLQKEVGETMDGYCTVIQLTERIFQAISYLSRVALGMEARIDTLSGRTRSSPVSREPASQQDAGLEMEIRDQEVATA